MLAIFSNKKIIDLLRGIVRGQLTAKQKEIILYICEIDQDVPVTRLVNQLAEHLACSKATVWNNLNQLKRIGILSYGDSTSKGLPVKVTSLGRVISEDLGGKENAMSKC